MAVCFENFCQNSSSYGEFPHVTFTREIDCENLRQPDADETASMLRAAVDIVRGFRAIGSCYQQLANAHNSSLLTYFATSSIRETIELSSIQPIEFAVLALMTLTWTGGRYCLERFLLNPLAIYVGILPKNLAKFNESAWKFFAYVLLWSTSFYVTFFSGHDFFYRTLQMFRPEANQSADLIIVYAMEASFYLHSIYATWYMDVKRKDTMAMMIHHVVTLILVFSSFKMSKLTVGVLIFVLDDINDVLLEGGKTLSYLSNTTRYGYSRVIDMAANVFAVLFTVFWVINRLYLHVTKVWRGGSYGSLVSSPKLPYPLLLHLNLIFASLYGFYCYWFYFILKMISRLLLAPDSGSSPCKAADADPREDDD